MTDGTPQQRTQIDVTTWSDAGSRDALSLVAASVAEMVGFEIAIISVVRGDYMYAVAVEGRNDAATAMIGVATPMAMVLPELDRSDDWGRFKFVPHERVSEPDVGGWIPDIEMLDAPDAWHPLDLLLAPLLDLDGALIGMLSIDVPMTGLRPDPTQRHLLERYANQAERALRMGVERNELAERIRLAEAAHRVVRFATAQADLDSVLDDCRAPLLEGFRADFLSIRVYETDGEPQAGTPVLEADNEVVAEIRALSRRCWADQQVLTSSATPDDGTVVTPEAFERIMGLAEELGLGGTMLVPLGAGHQSLGHLILGRKDPNFHWTPDELVGALDIARDIGQAVVNSRQLAREQRLVSELRRLATYKSQLLSTVSHELKNPLSAVSGHVEILEANPELDDISRRHVTALDRAARRMARVVDDLLLLAAVEDPDTDVPSEPLDVKPVLADALELIRIAADSREIVLTIDAPIDPVFTCCDPDDLDRVLTNLLSNAVKYSPRGGAITVTITGGDDEIEIAVTDEGIGISKADLDRLFTEFFRSTNPQAVAQPGTGLGLTICRRIVERHGGRIEVDSVLGEGSTFRVVMPAAPAPVLALDDDGELAYDDL